MKTLHLVDPAVRDVIASLRAFDPEREPLETFRAQLLATYAQSASMIREGRR
ncbi:hypothetical protein KYC5002_00580 [Archangium violaceum]|uniref:hypothetical protein n=1 Tax=Archangium violaceum TaxID=83451 RepID=UPI002B314EDC|nr:hypothetical protein KYC5002_00580 [Archangium gephyra]